MHWMNKLERKFGRYAIKNLIIYILGAYAVGYVFYYMEVLGIIPGIYEMLAMDPEAICHGQVWRLVTWVCTVPQQPGFFLIFMFLMYYWIGRTLEQVWGTFRYNLFIFMGLILMTVGPMLIYLVSGLIMGFDHALSLSASTYYLNLTSFLAFATIFPDQQVYFMFILPVKMKWLAILDAALLLWQVVQNLMVAIAMPIYRISCISTIVMIVLSVANFLIYFFATRNYKQISPKEIKRKRQFKKKVRQATPPGYSRNASLACSKSAS